MRWIGVLAILGSLGILGSFGALRIRKQEAFFPEYSHKSLQIGSHSIDVAIADTPERREKGLSGIEQLEVGQGLLFKFDTPGQYAFWMKDMRFSIDMVFIDSNMNVVEVIPNISPDTYPQAFSSKKKEYLYVLELGSGEAAKLNLEEGQVLHLSSSGSTRGSRIVSD